jgi:hypothetical protein
LVGAPPAKYLAGGAPTKGATPPLVVMA